MKIFFDMIPQKINLDKLYKFKKSSINQNEIYSNEGIFIIKNNIINKIIIKDDLKSKIPIEINNNKFTIDNSKIVYKQFNKIPFEFFKLEKKIEEYLLYDKCRVKLIIEFVGDNITDIYFISSLDIIDDFIKNDIISLLSLF